MAEIKTPSREDTDNIFDWIKLVPKIPIDEWGVTHTGEMPMRRHDICRKEHIQRAPPRQM